jgi:hypothetical protein
MLARNSGLANASVKLYESCPALAKLAPSPRAIDDRHAATQLRQIVGGRRADNACAKNNDVHQVSLAEYAIDTTEGDDSVSNDHCSCAHNFGLWA